jgi:hypothetical protein
VGNRSLFTGLTVLKAAPSKGKNEGGFDAKLAIFMGGSREDQAHRL